MIKSALLNWASKLIVCIPDAQKVDVEPWRFNKDERMNLVMKASPAAIEALSALDKKIMQQCFAESQHIFGKRLILDEVRLCYKSCLKLSITKGSVHSTATPPFALHLGHARSVWRSLWVSWHTLRGR